ncbi:MAG: PhzF family phenazine biosynthesis protein [Planctomycetota bacterium]
MRLEIVQYDSFTDRAFSGNPAAVVCDADGLEEDAMLAIAREMNLSETAFVFQAEEPGVDFRFRWFTPEAEVPFCGHATLAAAFALNAAGRWPASGDRSVARVTCRIGELRLSGEGENLLERVWIDVPWATLVELPETDAIYEACGIPADQRQVAGWRPLWNRARAKAVLPVTSAAALGAAQPDFVRLRHLAEELGCVLVLVTPEVREPESLVQTRVFAPHFGVDEDPVTGSANAILACYLDQLGWLAGREGVTRRGIAGGEVLGYRAEQGDFLGRPGRVSVEVVTAEGHKLARIGGAAVRVLEGTLFA